MKEQSETLAKSSGNWIQNSEWETVTHRLDFNDNQMIKVGTEPKFLASGFGQSLNGIQDFPPRLHKVTVINLEKRVALTEPVNEPRI